MSDNKDLIAQKALSLFSGKGYEEVGVQEICEASRITKPTLYHYFGSKRGLLEYITKTDGEKYFEELKNALFYEKDFIKTLTKVLKTEIKFACENKEFFNLHNLLKNAPLASEQREVYFPLVERIEGLYSDFFEISCNEFGNMRGKEKLYSILFQNQAISVAALCVAGKFEASEALVFQIIHSFIYGVAN